MPKIIITPKAQKNKRYLGSPIRYAGGKSLAVHQIWEHVPSNTKRIISPFIGGGSFEIYAAKEKDVEVVGFDIFDVLVNYWQIQIAHPIELYKRLLDFTPTKETFNTVKERLKRHWIRDELFGDDKESKIDLAAHYFFNHNTSYGPGFLSWSSSIYMQEKKYFSMLEKVKNFNISKLEVSCKSFEDVLPEYSNSFLYCDPPYYLDGDSKMFKGIYPQRNFPIHHKNFPHERLMELLHKHKGGFILSYNDCSQIREWYGDFKIIEVSWQYTMGQGETRIGINRIKSDSSHVKKSHEILIVKS